MIDYHMHTEYSPDAKQKMDQAVLQCKKLGITHMAITDHHDFFPDYKHPEWRIDDLSAYSKHIDRLKNENPEITIAKGIEIGITTISGEQMTEALDTVDFDFVIGSVHLVKGVDPYFPEYFANQTKHQAYMKYLAEVLECVDVLDQRTSVIGHIGYPARYAPYDDNKLYYHEFSEIIDKLLKRIIDRGFGLEINTSNFGKPLDDTMPPFDILKRYFDLGGQILTIGSDAHNVLDIGKGYSRARDIALKAGAKYICTFDKCKPNYIKL